MLLRLEREFLRRADFAQFDIGFGIGTDRHVGGRRIGNRREQVLVFFLDLALVGFALLDLGLEARHLLLEGIGARRIFRGHGLADLLGGGVAARLRLLQLLNRAAPFLVQAQNLIQRRPRIVEAAIGQPLEKGVRVVADPFDVEHWFGPSGDSKAPYKALFLSCHRPPRPRPDERAPCRDANASGV